MYHDYGLSLYLLYLLLISDTHICMHIYIYECTSIYTHIHTPAYTQTYLGLYKDTDRPITQYWERQMFKC